MERPCREMFKFLTLREHIRAHKTVPDLNQSFLDFTDLCNIKIIKLNVVYNNIEHV